MAPVKVAVVEVVVVVGPVDTAAARVVVGVVVAIPFMLAVVLSLLHMAPVAVAVVEQFVLFGVLVAHVAHHHSHQLMWEHK
jgi:hypothetical protein